MYQKAICLLDQLITDEPSLQAGRNDTVEFHSMLFKKVANGLDVIAEVQQIVFSMVHQIAALGGMGQGHTGIFVNLNEIMLQQQSH